MLLASKNIAEVKITLLENRVADLESKNQRLAGDYALLQTSISSRSGRNVVQSLASRIDAVERERVNEVADLNRRCFEAEQFACTTYVEKQIAEHEALIFRNLEGTRLDHQRQLTEQLEALEAQLLRRGTNSTVSPE